MLVNLVILFLLIPPSIARPVDPEYGSTGAYLSVLPTSAFPAVTGGVGLWFKSPSSGGDAGPTSDQGQGEWYDAVVTSTSVSITPATVSPSSVVIVAEVVTTARPVSISPSVDTATSVIQATTASTSPDPQSTDQVSWIVAHNSSRHDYGAGPVTWNTDLVTKAQANAELCTGKHS